MNLPGRRTFYVFLLFLLLGGGLYSHTLNVPFYFDDLKRIRHNPDIRVRDLGLTALSKAASGKQSSVSRPVGNITFALNYYIHGYEPAGYHVVNILIHVVNAFLLFLLVRTTLSMSGADGRFPSPSLVALLAGLLWLVHPLHIQSVTYIVQRLNALAALFFMTSMLLYIRGRRAAQGARRKAQEQDGVLTTKHTKSTKTKSSNLFLSSFLRALCAEKKEQGKTAFLLYGLAGLSWLLGLGCKQTTAMLPFFVLLYEWFFFQDLSRDWLKRSLKYLLGVVIVFGLIAVVYLGFHPLEKLESIRDYAEREFTYEERVLTQPRVVIHYLSLFFYPHPSRLNLDYDFRLSRSLIDPLTTLLSLGAVIGLLGLAVYAARRERLLSFCILWFFGNLVIESSVIPLAVIFEHRTYMPSMLLCLAVVLLLFRMVRRGGAVSAVVCMAVVLLSTWTYQRNEIWREPVAFWTDTVKKSPNKPRPHNNLGFALIEKGRLDEAAARFREAIRLKPDYADAHSNLGVVLKRQGKVKDAVRHFRKALDLQPDYALAHNNLGNTLTQLGQHGPAVRHLTAAVSLKPDYADAHNNLGNALAALGRLKEAASHYEAALRLEPTYDKAHFNLGNTLVRQGDVAGAVHHYLEALRLNPDFPGAHNNLGVTLKRQGRIQEAIDHYMKALRLQPGYVEAHNNLGVALMAQGRLKQAEVHFLKALDLRPGYAQAAGNLEGVRRLMARNAGRAGSAEKTNR